MIDLLSITSRNKLVYILAILLIVFYICNQAWLAEDAFITFRVVDNFVHGFGLRWNIDERVQVFTNPLWMLIHIPFYAITHEIFYTSAAISIVTSAAAIIVLGKPYVHKPWLILSFFLCPLVASRAFIEYSTSGLENAMSHLLLVCFFSVFVKIKKHVPWFTLSLITALAMMNRMDAIIFLTPAWLFLIFHYRSIISIRSLFMGGLPFIAWCLFAALYYGFPLPNTKYAKLNTGLSHWDYILQSRYYFYDLWKNHLPSAVIISASIITTIKMTFKNRPRYIWAGFGLISYIAYISYVGSDHYSGRFWSSVTFLSVFVLLDATSNIRLYQKQYAVCAAFSSLLFVAFLVGQKIEDTQNVKWPSGIENARNIISGVPLSKIKDGVTTANNEWINSGIALRQEFGADNITRVRIETAAGFMPFHAGPNFIFIDFLALTDPLMSRLPVADKKKWHASHYWRTVPKGYVHARETGDLSQMDKALASYYAALRTVTSDPIFSRKRLQTILNFAIGGYDIYLELYKRSNTIHHP